MSPFLLFICSLYAINRGRSKCEMFSLFPASLFFQSIFFLGLSFPSACLVFRGIINILLSHSAYSEPPDALFHASSHSSPNNRRFLETHQNPEWQSCSFLPTYPGLYRLSAPPYFALSDDHCPLG